MKVTGRILVGWLPAVVILVVGPWLVAAQQTDDEARTSPSAITTADQAVELALEYTGFDDTAHASIGAIDEPVLAPTPHDSLSPVQYSELGGRQAWRVTMREVVLEIEGAGPRSNAETPRDLNLYIDVTTGTFLKAVIGSSGRIDGRRDTWRGLLESLSPLYQGAHTTGNPPSASFLTALRNQCAKGIEVESKALETENPVVARHPFTHKETELYLLTIADPESTATGPDSIPFWLIVTKDYMIQEATAESGPKAVRPTIRYWPVELDSERPCRLCMITELSYPSSDRIRSKYEGRRSSDTTPTPIDSSLRRRE
jgi:hypothetical protein